MSNGIGTILIRPEQRVDRMAFWRGVLERLVWFTAGVIVAVLCRMGTNGADTFVPSLVPMVVEVRCDCNWHLMADSAIVYELTVSSENMNDLAKGLRAVANEMKRTRRVKK